MFLRYAPLKVPIPSSGTVFLPVFIGQESQLTTFIFLLIRFALKARLIARESVTSRVCGVTISTFLKSVKTWLRRPVCSQYDLTATTFILQHLHLPFFFLFRSSFLFQPTTKRRRIYIYFFHCHFAVNKTYRLTFFPCKTSAFLTFYFHSTTSVSYRLSRQ